MKIDHLWKHDYDSSVTAHSALCGFELCLSLFLSCLWGLFASRFVLLKQNTPRCLDSNITRFYDTAVCLTGTARFYFLTIMKRNECLLIQ